MGIFDKTKFRARAGRAQKLVTRAQLYASELILFLNFYSIVRKVIKVFYYEMLNLLAGEKNVDPW